MLHAGIVRQQAVWVPQATYSNNEGAGQDPLQMAVRMAASTYVASNNIQQQMCFELRWGVLQHMPGLLDASKGLQEACCRAQHTLLLHKVVPAAALHGRGFSISEKDWMGQQRALCLCSHHKDCHDMSSKQCLSGCVPMMACSYVGSSGSSSGGSVILQSHAAPLLGCERNKKALGGGITLCNACLLHTWSSSRLDGAVLLWQHLWIW